MPGCPDCPNNDLDTGETNDALADDEEHDYFCQRCGGLFTEGEV